MKYLCNSCGHQYDASTNMTKCECGAALALDFIGHHRKADIVQDDFSMWRYAGAYPLSKADIKISFGEGLTPFIAIDYRGYRLKIKQDNLLPTGSFKDRGVAMVTNFLNIRGVSQFTEDSSGNGGSSYAGYCALGNIGCKIYVPAGTSQGKIAQMKVYGAHLIEITGTRTDVATAAMKGSQNSVYVGHNWHPLFVHGVKSVAYEMWEQNGFIAPDQVVCVAGNGSMVTGIYLGFKELLQSGEIGNMPKIFAIQSDHCNPLYREFIGDRSVIESKSGIAEGISVAHPTRLKEVVAQVRATQGAIISVSDKDIIAALFDIGKRGFYIEPTSATGFAGLNKLIEQGLIEKTDTTAIIISGNGLKATVEILPLL